MNVGEGEANLLDDVAYLNLAADLAFKTSVIFICSSALLSNCAKRSDGLAA
jgi:hypothetical protein